MAEEQIQAYDAGATPNPGQVVAFLSSIELLSGLRPEEQYRLAEHVEVRTFELGDTIVTAGQASTGLFVIRSGRVRLFNEVQGKETSIGVLHEGDVFGELSALRACQHEFSARTSSKVALLFVPAEAFKPLLALNRKAEALIASYAAIRAAGGFVTQLFELRGKVEQSEIEGLIGSVGIKRMRAGQVILEQDARDDRRLYVIRQGTVSLVRREQGDEYRLADLQQGDIFGEKACLLRQEQTTAAIANTDVVLLLVPEETLRFVLERNPKLREVIEERIEFLDRELARQQRLKQRRFPGVRLDLASKPHLGERVIKRFPLMEQAEEMDCGAACLAMICKHHGIAMTLGKLRELVNVTTEGATLESIARVGELLGFTTRGVKSTYKVLQGFSLPFVAHWEGYHFVVVYGVSKRHVWVADPGPGFRKMTVDEFEKGWTGTCLLFTPSAEKAEVLPSRSPWRRFAGYLRPYKGILAHLLMATLVIELLGVAPPIITQNILDRVIVHDNTHLLTVLIIGLILVKVFAQLTALMRESLMNFMVRNMDFAMMSSFYKHTLALPISFFASRRTGDVIARFQENEAVRSFLTESTVGTVLDVLMIFIYVTVMFFYDVKLTVLLLAFAVPLALLTGLITPKIKSYARRTFEASTDAESMLMETIGGAETVKAMGVERPMRLKWEKKYANSLNVRYQSRRFEIVVGFASELLNAAATVTILWVGALMVLSQDLTIGQLVAFTMLLGSVMSPLTGLIGLWDELHETGVAMERLGDVLDLPPEQKPEDVPSRIVLPELQSDIRLDHVFFRYGGRETPYVLQDVSCEIKSGELAAIVGQSGSGKTTLAKLLVGFYPPTEGKIYVDGYDLSLIDKHSYRAQIGYVMQSNLLFSGSIAENIAIGDENPDRRRIIEVAKLADAHGFIGNLPVGYEQVVGERGVGLSGGQIQRLCIARALYHDPPLLIFDEATSSLDAQSESNILNNMQGILEGRTAIVIAHRLSTIMRANKILVFYDGAIVEAGAHQELLAKKGMYHQLVQKQMAAS